jgi:hypothetical protein
MSHACDDGRNNPPDLRDAGERVDGFVRTPSAVSEVALSGVVQETSSNSVLKHWADAYVGRQGISFGPGLPGWRQMSQLTGRTAWSKSALIEGRVGSRLRAIGASITFPIGQEGPGLRQLSLWLNPSTRRQAVSVFLDDKPLATLKVKVGWKQYHLPLPDAGLGVGEHRLRLWFRRMGTVRKLRTPGSLGMVVLSPGSVSDDTPEVWINDSESNLAWHAGPPARWSVELVIPPDGALKTGVRVGSGPPVQFSIHVSRDGEGTTEVGRKTVHAGTSASLNVDLRRWSGKIVRLHLRSTGARRGLSEAHWTQVDLIHRQPMAKTIPKVRNVIIFVVEGMWANIPSLGRSGPHVPTQNLDLLRQEGALAINAWSGGLSSGDTHARILGAADEGGTWIDRVRNSGVTTGFWSSNPRFNKGLLKGFTTVHKARSSDHRLSFDTEFQNLDEWVYARGKNRFLLYIDLAMAAAVNNESKVNVFRTQPRVAAVPPVTDVAVQRADFWLGQLVGALGAYGLLNDTAVLVVGTATRTRGSYAGTTLSPARLSVPIVLWHPGMRKNGQSRAAVYGADVEDIQATVSDLLEVRSDPSASSRTLSEFMFNGMPMNARVSQAKTAYGWVVRYGGWTFWPRAAERDRLWHRDDALNPKEIHLHPIVVRALRHRAASLLQP